MVRFGKAAVALALLASDVDAFSPRSLLNVTPRQCQCSMQRGVSAAEFLDGEDNLLQSTVSELKESFLADSEEDAELEAELSLKRRKIQERAGTFQVTLPIRNTLGLGLRQVDKPKGGKPVFSDMELNLETLLYRTPLTLAESATVHTMDTELVTENMDESSSFQGVVVSSVVEGSSAWEAGVRPGDILKSSSATLGEALWPKSTLEGVRSAVSSRKVVSGSMSFEFQRAKQVDNLYELSLSKPLGIQVRETPSGYVEVCGFTEKASRLVKYAIKIGDRVVAVDSTLGDRMWPISTVEGLISACTSRLPGQQVTLRLERPQGNLAIETIEESPMPIVKEREMADQIAPPVTNDQEQLLKRCRNAIRKYASEEQVEARKRFADRPKMPALVAEKVLDSLASASAALDSVTLSMLMNAYLSSGSPEGAIRAFENAVGLNANGSSLPRKTEILVGKDGGKLVENPMALNLYTASSLLRAHSVKGDIAAVLRVLAALEGRSGVSIENIESTSWAETGVRAETGINCVAPDTQCYNIALSAVVKAGGEHNLETALFLFDSMGIDGRPARDLVAYNTMISALANAGRFDDAIKMFYELKGAGFKPDKYSFTSLLQACVITGDIEELLYDMEEAGIKPDVIAYNAIIKTLCEQGNFNEAKSYVVKMEMAGVAPNSLTYGYLMSGFIKAGRPRTALTLFETASLDVKTVSRIENIRLYTTAITAASALGDHERALELVSRMSMAGIKPNIKTLTALMGACLSAGNASLAVDVYRKISEPDAIATIHGLQALCATGKIDEALDILESQGNVKKLLSGKQAMSSYDSLITAAVDMNDFGAARRAVRSLLRNGFIPSKAMLNSIISSLGLAIEKRKRNSMTQKPEYDVDEEFRKFQFLLFLLDSIQQRGLVCEGILYAAIVTCGFRIGGTPRKVSSLLVEARATTEPVTSVASPSDGVESTSQAQIGGWEDVLGFFTDAAEDTASQLLPILRVRINSKELRQVLMAEQQADSAGRKLKPRQARRMSTTSNQ